MTSSPSPLQRNAVSSPPAAVRSHAMPAYVLRPPLQLPSSHRRDTPSRRSQCFMRQANNARRTTPPPSSSNGQQPDTNDNDDNNNNASTTARPLITKLLAVTTAALTTFANPWCLHATHAARGQKQSVITMTDQVPNFTLPSQEDDLASPRSGTAVLLRVARTAKTVLPPVSAAFLLVCSFLFVRRKLAERRARDFQQQLEAFSSGLASSGTSASREAVASSTPRAAIPTTAAANTAVANDVAPRTSRGGGVGSGSGGGGGEDEVSSKVRLDLFRPTGGADNASSNPDANEPATALSATTAARNTISDLVVGTEFESRVLSAIRRAAEGSDAVVAEATTALADARTSAAVSDLEADVMIADVVSRLISLQIDRAYAAGGGVAAIPGTNGMDDADSTGDLHALGLTLKAVRALGVHGRLRYVGDDVVGSEDGQNFFRQYATYCLVGEPRVDDDLQSLDDIQELLAVSNEAADAMRQQIAKGMFQVAVSAAMADGTMSDDDRTALESVKTSFSDFLDGDSADSIVSEVAVMRAMYSLQKLIQEQGVSPDDVRQLRHMCASLGVDVDEMLQNAGNLGDALGPEAKNFVDSLRAMLTNPQSEQDPL